MIKDPNASIPEYHLAQSAGSVFIFPSTSVVLINSPPSDKPNISLSLSATLTSDRQVLWSRASQRTLFDGSGNSANPRSGSQVLGICISMSIFRILLSVSILLTTSQHLETFFFAGFLPSSRFLQYPSHPIMLIFLVAII